MNRDDLLEVLQMYNDVTRRLEVSHEKLQGEVMRLRDQLEEKNRELELKKRLAALGEMAAGIAHEIRNPLGGIQLYASSLAADVADRPAAADLVRKISNGVRSLNALVSDILAFTHNTNLRKSQEELGLLVDNAIELAQPILTQHGIQVQVDGGLRRIEAQVDGKLLGRVLLNLILNSAEALAEQLDRGIKIPMIFIQGSKNGNKTTLEIADNGPGIPSAALWIPIFNPFLPPRTRAPGWVWPSCIASSKRTAEKLSPATAPKAGHVSVLHSERPRKHRSHEDTKDHEE